MLGKHISVLALALVVPIAAEAAVEYGNSWTGNGAKVFQQQVEAPAGRYKVEISTDSKSSVQVYNRFNGSRSAPIISLNSRNTGNTGSAEIELKATKPDHAFGYAPLEVRVGKGSGGGSYQLSITPLF